MRETHVPLESVWERLVRAVKEGSKQPSKSLKGSKLRRTSNLTFLKSGLKLHTKKQWSRLSLRTIEYATNTNKKYFYRFIMNQIIFTYGERKRNGLTFTEFPVNICRILLLSPPYWKWSYHNATQSECAHRLGASQPRLQIDYFIYYRISPIELMFATLYSYKMHKFINRSEIVREEVVKVVT